MYFIELVVFWHFFSRLMRVPFEIYRQKLGSPLPLAIVCIVAFLAKLVWVIWFTEAIERKYGFTKHFYVGLYVFLQLVNGTNLGEMSQDFWYFLADTLILTQICAIYFMNELNFSIFNSYTPVVLSILTYLLIRGLWINQGDKQRLCLVKTLGKHDAVFLILLYALVVLLLCVIDFFSVSYWAALGGLFFLHALVVFPGLMESKYVFSYISSILMIGLMTGLTIYQMTQTVNPYPREQGETIETGWSKESDVMASFANTVYEYLH